MTITVEQQKQLDALKCVGPTDLVAAANIFGLSIYSCELAEGVSGMIVRDDDEDAPSGFSIFVDRNEPSARQRFTAAHEIGHFVHHRHLIGEEMVDNYLLRAEGMTNRQEAEANRFAADLLMPHDKIAEAMEQGYRTVEQLADLFGVSKVAMGIRLGSPT